MLSCEGDEDIGNNISASPSPTAVSSAVCILNKYAGLVDPSEAINLLPKESVSVQELDQFLTCITKKIVEERKSGQLFRHLLLSQHLQVQEKRIRLQQAHKVMIEDSDLCRVCQKRIGKRYVFFCVIS